MALRGIIEARCPKGCAPREVEVWSFIRGDKDEELRERVLAGELNLISCEDCGEIYYADASVVYCDPAAGILVFTFPESYRAQEDYWRQRMREDHEVMRTEWSGHELLETEPELVFGMEPLQELLRRDDAIEDEVRIAEALAGELGLALIEVDRAWARRHALPWKLPCRGSSRDALPKTAVDGVRSLLKTNDRLEAYGRWLPALASGKELPPLKHGQARRPPR